MIEKYIENIVSKVWIGTKSSVHFNMSISEIKDIFIHLSLHNKNVFLGKTEKFYFILNGIDEDNISYGFLFLNTDLKNLILAYQDRKIFNADSNVDTFVNNLELNYRLNKKLSLKNKPQTKFKI